MTRTALVEKDGRQWVTAGIEDTGPGIPEEELGCLFDRFWRGRQALDDQIAGTGLGLCLAKALIELHGGQLTVESTVGEGTVFTIWLPRAHADP